MIEKFKKYVDKFDFTDTNIERKYYHSLRVMELCEKIAKDMKLSAENIELAKVIGLLHDYGRFMQVNKYHTFSDMSSIDHGDYGVRMLFDNNEISSYWGDKNDYDIIYDAIKYHNKLEIPKGLDNRNNMFCQIVRDADKLDILYIFASKIFILPEDDDISLKVKETFEDEKQINRKDEISGADRVITTLALIYDLNYKYSFRYLKKTKLVEQIYDNINDKGKFKYYFDKVIKYVNDRSK